MLWNASDNLVFHPIKLFSFFLKRNFPGRKCEGSINAHPIFATVSTACCSTLRPLAVIFAGYDWKCLCIMYATEYSHWLHCCMFKGLLAVNLWIRMLKTSFVKASDRPNLLFLWVQIRIGWCWCKDHCRWFLRILLDDLVRFSLLADFRFQICVLLMVHYFMNSFVAFLLSRIFLSRSFSVFERSISFGQPEGWDRLSSKDRVRQTPPGWQKSHASQDPVKPNSRCALFRTYNCCKYFDYSPPLPQEGPRQTAVDVLTLTPKETSPAFPPAAKPDIWISADRQLALLTTQ